MFFFSFSCLFVLLQQKYIIKINLCSGFLANTFSMMLNDSLVFNVCHDKISYGFIFILIWFVLLFKIKKELNPVKDDFEKKNATLMKELPELYHARLSYMQPSLEAFISTQVGTTCTIFLKEVLLYYG